MFSIRTHLRNWLLLAVMAGCVVAWFGTQALAETKSKQGAVQPPMPAPQASIPQALAKAGPAASKAMAEKVKPENGTTAKISAQKIQLGTWPDWVVVVFTAALTSVAVFQYRLDGKLAKETAISIEMARRSATAAEVALADAKAHTHLQLRPWVAVSVRNVGGITYPEVGMHTYFEITLKNVGLSPAKSVKLRTDFRNRRYLTDIEVKEFYDTELSKADASPEIGLVLLPNEEVSQRIGTKIFRKDFGEGLNNEHYLFPLLMVSVVYRADMIAGGTAQTAKTIFMSENNDTGGRCILVEAGEVPETRINLRENGLYGRAT